MSRQAATILNAAKMCVLSQFVLYLTYMTSILNVLTCDRIYMNTEYSSNWFSDKMRFGLISNQIVVQRLTALENILVF